MSADAVAPATTMSKISAIVEFGLADIDRALERKIPKRLVSFEDCTSRCWHRRVLGRMVDIDCTDDGSQTVQFPDLSFQASAAAAAAAD